MAMKLGNLSRWNKLDADKVLTFGEPHRQQRLRIEFNVSDSTHLTAIDNLGAERFIGVITGHETVEFSVNGQIEIVPTTEGEVWWYTSDGDPEAMELIHEVPFTRVMQRRARNPELELMMYKMNENIERRIAAEFRAHQVAQAAMATKFDSETGEIEENEDEQVPADDTEGENGVQPAAEVPPASPAK